VDGVGVCPAIAVPLEHPPGACLVLARSGPDGRLSREEVTLLHGMARVTSMTLAMQHLLDDERAARAESQRQATEKARLVEALTERQEELDGYVAEQAALRRVAVLVARGVPQDELLGAVAEEVSRLSSADLVRIYRYEPDGTGVRVAVWGDQAGSAPLGIRFPPGGHNMLTMVLTTGRPARIDDAA
ncbi:MAG: hypothetical protein ACREQ5_28510, partial [Candidatus Dormibacteria bacterium]